MLTCRYYIAESNFIRKRLLLRKCVRWSVNFEWNWFPHLLKLLISCLFEICPIEDILLLTMCDQNEKTFHLVLVEKQQHILRGAKKF